LRLGVSRSWSGFEVVIGVVTSKTAVLKALAWLLYLTHLYKKQSKSAK
jgi:hypothetical protein